MTVQTSTNVAGFVGNGATTSFPIGFKFNSSADLIVESTNTTTGITTTLSLNSDYTAQGAGDESGGTITFATAPSSVETVKVTRRIDLLQLTDLRNQGKFYAEIHEDVFDRLVMIDQQQQTEINDANTKSDDAVATANAADAKADQAVAKADQNLVDMQAQYDAFEQGAALVVIGDYAPGLVVDGYNKIFRKDGEFYRADASLSLPYTLTGDWLAESTKFVSVGDAVLRQELASAGGGQIVGFQQVGEGAALRTIEDKARESVSAEDYIGTDAEKLARGVNALGGLGGTLSLTRRGYTAPVTLNYNTPVSFEGTGGVYSAIDTTGMAANADAFCYSPSPDFDHTLGSIQRLHIGSYLNGQRAGRAAVRLETLSPGQNLSKFTVRDVIVGQGTGAGIHHVNDPIDNINGGLFCARFENSQIKGGITLEGSGDSNTISHCILSGGGIGVDASLVSGASLLSIENNNITTSGGAIRINAGSRFRILGNNIEHYSLGASDQAVVNIAGGSGTMNSGEIRANLISAFGGTDATRLLRLSNCQGTLVEGNVFLRGAGGVAHAIVIDNNCVSVRIGANVFSTNWANPILDNGIGTMGLLKNAVLQNGWVPFTGSVSVPAETARFIKSTDGLVTISGSIKDGTTTNGTLLFTLPAGFRPATVVRSPAYAYNIAGTTHIAELIIDTDGSVLVNWAQGAQLSINCTFPAALLANVESDL